MIGASAAMAYLIDGKITGISGVGTQSPGHEQLSELLKHRLFAEECQPL